MKALLSLLALCFSQLCFAQVNSGVYDFENGFNEQNKHLPALTVLGKKGTFETKNLAELGISKTVYVFEKNNGLSLDVSNIDYFDGSYSIEIYFMFDNLESWRRVLDWKNRKTDNGAYIYSGQLNFYNLIKSDVAPVAPGKFSHYILSKDSKTKVVNIYANGIGKITFRDEADETVIDRDQKLNFFFDDLKVENEASSGMVAFIKLYDHVIEPTEAKTLFKELPKRIVSKENTTVVNNHKAEEVLLFKGTVLSKKDQQAVPAMVKLTDLQNSSTMMQYETNNEGHFDVYKHPKSDFKVEITAAGYYPLITTLDKATKSHTYYLEALQLDEDIVLKNVLFHRGLDSLLQASYAELDRVISILKTNPSYTIELSGHTDSNGKADENLLLSQQRVQRVQSYFIEQGIDPKRISGKGYGESKPKYDNSIPEQRKLNRRVEFKLQG